MPTTTASVVSDSRSPQSPVSTSFSNDNKRQIRSNRDARSPTPNSSPDTKNHKSVLISQNPTATSKTSLYGRAGGAYIPPARLRALQASITDRSSEDYQRMTWEALKKSINGLVNKVSVANIKNIIPELFSENLIRGRGLLCQSIMKAQTASLPFTPVYASLIAVVNTKFPVIGDLLLNRLLAQFRRAFRRSDKTVCLASSKFIAHLVNHRVANEIIALQILTLLIERPTDDSVEVAVGFMREVGTFLTEESPKATNAVFERFRSILHESQIDKRTQYMIEVLFQVRKDKFKDNLAIPEGLDIVEEADQITHMVSLPDELVTEDILNVFKLDPDFLDSEEKYQAMKREILGDDSDESGSGSASDADGSDEDEEEAEAGFEDAQKKLVIQDETNTNLINLRRGIYLTIMSSLNFEECAHKLMKLNIQSGQEIELCNMIIECCSQERTYVNFYGLLGERFCRINQGWASSFAQAFEETYKTIHRFETNRLRNTAKYFSHLLATDALTWQVFALVRITEAETTASSRIFLKTIFQDLSESFGLKKLRERLFDKTMTITVATSGGMALRGAFDGLFPKDNPKNTRFAINYFTSIGLGSLTEDLREHLKNAPKLILQQKQAIDSSSDSSSDSDSDSSDSDSESDSSGSQDSSSSSSSDSSSDSLSGSETDTSDAGQKQSFNRRRASPKSTQNRSNHSPRSVRRVASHHLTRSTSPHRRDRSISSGAPFKNDTDRNKNQSRDRYRERSRDRSIARGRDRSIDRGRDRSIDRGRDRSIDRNRDRSIDRGRDRSIDRGRDRSIDRNRDRSIDRGRDRSIDKSRSRIHDRSRSRSVNHRLDRGRNYRQSSSRDRSRSRSIDRSRNRNRGLNTSRSRSPSIHRRRRSPSQSPRSRSPPGRATRKRLSRRSPSLSPSESSSSYRGEYRRKPSPDSSVSPAHRRAVHRSDSRDRKRSRRDS
ncbi:pre-mRNA-splicing factor cwc22 [Batrachochytrium dendrobatidis]|nr:pre-mRNA-splicing factor cwc22 [Batrachochytrium dendrobatidis]